MAEGNVLFGPVRLRGSRIVVFRLTQEEFAWVEGMCHEVPCTVSSFIRALLRDRWEVEKRCSCRAKRK